MVGFNPAQEFEANFQQAWDEGRICTYCSTEFDTQDERDGHLMDEERELDKCPRCGQTGEIHPGPICP